MVVLTCCSPLFQLKVGHPKVAAKLYNISSMYGLTLVGLNGISSTTAKILFLNILGSWCVKNQTIYQIRRDAEKDLIGYNLCQMMS